MKYLKLFNESIDSSNIRNDIKQIKKYLKYTGITENEYQKMIDDTHLFDSGKLFPTDKDKKVLYDDNDKGKYWGFHASYFGVFNILYTIKSILEKNGKSNIKLIDIGCGVGNVVRICNKMGYNSEGIEYQKELSKHHNDIRVKYGDVFDNMDSLKDKDVIYLYQPFYDDNLEAKFLNKLYDIVNEGTVVIYTHLSENPVKWDILKQHDIADDDIYCYILMKKNSDKWKKWKSWDYNQYYGDGTLD
jgi:hypothetical protein